MQRYEDMHDSQPRATASAPGRVNLLGEHTDYNDGFVLPTAIPQRTEVTVGYAAPDGDFVATSANLGRRAVFAHDRPPAEPFARIVHGCVRLLAERGDVLPPLHLHVRSDVPIGVGLSSSAALAVATLRALRQLRDLALDDLQIAQLAQQAEMRFAGVQCGIMDPLASSLAGPGQLLFVDTRSLERRTLPLPDGAQVLVLDSGVPRALAGSPYNRRRDECHAAARALGVAALRDVDDEASLDGLPEPLRQRARHVVRENARVLEAAAGVDAARFGVLMNASHCSLRDDFEVSHPALDRLVALLWAQPAVFGARLTGAGFGGACVALCRTAEAVAVADAVLAAFAAGGGFGARLVPPAGQGGA